MHRGATKVNRLIPGYDYLFEGKKLDLKAANTCLCQNPSKDKLSKGFVLVHTQLKTLARVHASWGFSVAMKDDRDWGDSVLAVENMWKSVKRCVAITGAINTLVNLKGKEKTDKAQSVINKHMPIFASFGVPGIAQSRKGGSA